MIYKQGTSLPAKYATWFFILLPILLLISTVYYFSEDLFFADDFHLLKTIVWSQETDAYAEKFVLFTQQHNEHRIVVPRLITWLDYQLQGHIDWPVLMLLGNLVWCGILYFLWTAFRSLKYPFWYFLPIPWLLFQPAYYDNYTWTISVLQQSVIVFLLTWLVHAFVKRRVGLAMFIVLLGTFTHGNGIFGFGIGLVFLVLYREWRWLILWLALAAVVAAVYFYGFQKGQNADFLQSLSNPGRLIAYFLAFFGAITQIVVLADWPSVIWGGVLVLSIGGAICIWLYLNWDRIATTGYFERMLLGNFLFLAVTALLVSVSRSWGAQDLFMPPRYAHYSPYLTSWFYLLSLSVLYKNSGLIRAWAGTWTAGAVVVCAMSYFHYLPNVANRRDWLIADAANWHTHSTFVQYPPSFNRNIKEVYRSAVQRGICRSEPVLPSTLGKARVDTSISLNFRSTEMVTQEVERTIRESMLSISCRGYGGPTPLLAMVPEQGAPVWLPFMRPRNAYRAMLLGKGLFGPEMEAQALLENLPAGRYRLALFTPDKVTYTRYRIVIDASHAYRIF